MGFKRNMNITNISNQTFNGYKNLIADHSKVGDAESATIIMQLDNLGTNDLEKYEELKQKIPNIQDTDDILALTYSKRHKDDAGTLMINDAIMLRGEELSDLEDNYDKYFSSFENYKAEEGNTVKLYTFLANLTKRIANDNKLGIDIDYRKVAFTAHKIFNSIACNATIAFQYLQQVLNKNMPPQEVAQKLNDEIVKSMLPFFK